MTDFSLSVSLICASQVRLGEGEKNRVLEKAFELSCHDITSEEECIKDYPLKYHFLSFTLPILWLDATSRHISVI